MVYFYFFTGCFVAARLVNVGEEADAIVLGSVVGGPVVPPIVLGTYMVAGGALLSTVSIV